MLRDYISKYYFDANCNCAEAVLRAGNEFYQLGLRDQDMLLVSAYGAGMQTGHTCGAVLSALSLLSMKYVEARAHESSDIQPAARLLTRKVMERYESLECRYIRPQVFTPGQRCYEAVTAICDMVEEVFIEYEAAYHRF